MLDEIDKVGRDFRGDPASALLEALDPEQNSTFRDNYLDVTFDLSKVLFITTANMLDPIAEPLRDRMEIIELQGYSEEEKLHIARRYLVPRQVEENGITAEQIEFPDEALRYVIRHYTREAGVRSLERTIGTICRKQARRLAEGKTEKLVVTEADHSGISRRHQDPHRRRNRRTHRAPRRGRRPGLDSLRRRRALRRSQCHERQRWIHHDRPDRPGHAGIHAGSPNLGALQRRATGHRRRLLRRSRHSHARAGRSDSKRWSVSAGVTMATTLVSLLSGHRIRPLTAMTGEITLSGNVLPVGGIKEKVLAAKRAGVTTIILPAENKMNVEEDLTPEQVENLSIHYVKTIEEALRSLAADSGGVAGRKGLHGVRDGAEGFQTGTSAHSPHPGASSSPRQSSNLAVVKQFRRAIVAPPSRRLSSGILASADFAIPSEQIHRRRDRTAALSACDTSDAYRSRDRSAGHDQTPLTTDH